MKRFGLIGRSLGHSASAAYFTEKFAREGLAATHRYDLFELPSIDDLGRLLEETPDLCGFNVTIPYKQQIIPLLDGLSFEAGNIGAVNCVKRVGGRLVGYNTDVVGLRRALGGFLGDVVPDEALVLGTGGASQAVQYVLAELGIAYELVSRDPAKGNLTYDGLACETVASHRLIVNATPVGTYPAVDEAPRLPYAFVSPGHYLFDLVYNPPLTRFLDYGRQRGAHVSNGREMFVGQAEAAWRIWSDEKGG